MRFQKETAAPFRQKAFYREFQVWAQSFNQMLLQLDTYYRDIYQQKLLIKNAEIRALQSQMDPHFLFNVLNTIAWKAQMIDNEEIYEMVISPGKPDENEHPLPKSQFHFHFKRNGICATLCISSADAFRGQNFLRYPDTGTGSFLRNPPVFPFSHLWKMQLSTVWNPRKEKVI